MITSKRDYLKTELSSVESFEPLNIVQYLFHQILITLIKFISAKT